MTNRKRAYCIYCGIKNYYQVYFKGMIDEEWDLVYDSWSTQTCTSCGAPLREAILKARDVEMRYSQSLWSFQFSAEDKDENKKPIIVPIKIKIERFLKDTKYMRKVGSMVDHIIYRKGFIKDKTVATINYSRIKVYDQKFMPMALKLIDEFDKFSKVEEHFV